MYYLNVAYFLSLSLCLVIALQDEKRLQENLINGYNRLVRPVERNTDQLVVKFGIRLIQILDVDEKNQILTTNVWLKHTWRDTNLMWNPADYNNLTSISIPSSYIWVPDIILFNSANGKYEVTAMTRAKIEYSGAVLWEPPAIYKSSCTINVEFFPFDQQHCVMKFGSWTYDGLQVDLIHNQQPTNKYGEIMSDSVQVGIDLLDFQQNHEWDIISVPAKRSVLRLPNSDEFYPDITFNITLRRKTLFYTFNLIIPCVGISFLTVLTFYLPSDSGEKISLCISILVSLTFFVLLLYELIPPTSLVVPLIGKYILFTVILVTLSIFSTVVVLNVHFRSPSAHKQLPSWARRLFLIILPRMLGLHLPEFKPSMLVSPNYIADVAHFLTNQNENATIIELKRLNSVISRYSTKSEILFRSRREKLIYYDTKKAICAVNDMVANLKREDQEKKIKLEWKYTALVIDRLFLYMFTTSCLVGTIAIILQAPSFYDHKIPIDEQMSKNFKKS